MALRNRSELDNTKAKLARLEARLAERSPGVSRGDLAHQLSMQALKQTINQFKEEIARYEARQAVHS
jgi:hypothetical protein